MKGIGMEQKIIDMIKKDNQDLIYLVLNGSRSHGTYDNESDYDYRGAFANTKQEIFGFDVRESVDYKDGDIVLHSLHKFMALALNANPNVLELLFIDDMIIDIHPLFREYILKHREKLISIRAGIAYGGFAKSQITRNKNRAGHGSIGIKYRFGPKEDLYDSKYAMHTIRMLLNGIEMMTKGTLHPKMEGNDLILLKSIRAGSEFEDGTDFYNYASKLDIVLQREITRAKVEVRFPEYADKKFFSNKLVEFYEEYYEHTYDFYHDSILTMEQ